MQHLSSSTSTFSLFLASKNASSGYANSVLVVYYKFILYCHVFSSLGLYSHIFSLPHLVISYLFEMISIQLDSSNKVLSTPCLIHINACAAVLTNSLYCVFKCSSSSAYASSLFSYIHSDAALSE